MAGSDTTQEDDELGDLKKDFARCQDVFGENYKDAEDDIRFARLGEQWPAKIAKDRELDGRPCLTINKLPPIIRQVVNDGRQNKPAISVHPVDSGADPETAEVITGLIRHIEQSSDAEVAYDTALDNAASGGFGFFGINTRYATDDGFEQDIVIERKANPLAIYGDPDSTACDSSDWMRAFELERISEAAFKRRFKGADAVSFEGDGTDKAKSGAGETLQIAYAWVREESVRAITALSPMQPEAADANPDAFFAAMKLAGERMVIDVAIYEKNKALFDALGMQPVGQPRDVPSHKVTQKILSGADVLKTVDWAGSYIPLVPVYGEEVNLEGKRYWRSLVRDAKDAQRMFNYWRTMSTELVALAPKAPFIGPEGFADASPEKWATANTENHAYLEYATRDANGQPTTPPQRQPFAGPPAGALQEALNAADDIKAITGIYDASLGARSNETSGRAIMARQREGDVSTFHFIDNLSRAIRCGGRIVLDLIPKVYSTDRMIRILGPEGDAMSVRVNPTKPIVGNTPQSPEQESAEQGQRDEANELARVFDLTAGKYDLTVTAGPSFTSRREEAASQMIELIRAYPQAAPLIGDLLAKNLDWPGADEIAERMTKMLPAQLQGDSPEAQQAKAQIDQMAQAIGKLKGELAAAKADHSIEQRSAEIDAYNAETSRLKAIAPKGTGFDEMQMAQVAMRSLFTILQSPDILEAANAGAPPEELMAMHAAKMGQGPQGPGPGAEPQPQPQIAA